MSYFNDPLLAISPLLRARDRLLQSVTPPTGEPVALADAKLYMRLSDTSEDSLVTNLITAARMQAESWLRRSLLTQSWKLAYDEALPLDCRLPMGPVTAITSVTQFNYDNSSLVADPSQYRLNAAQDALRLCTPLLGMRIEVVYTAGYGAAADVPQPIIQGMLAHIAALYDNRGDDGGSSLPAQTMALYAPYRLGGL